MAVGVELTAWQPASILTVLAALISGAVSRLLSKSRSIPASAVEIVLGIAFANLLGWHPDNNLTRTVSDAGLFILLVSSGFESGEEVVANRLGSGASLALIGAFSAAAFALIGSVAAGFSLRVSLLFAVAVAPTSVGIASRTFADLGLMRSRLASLVLAVAVIDDVVGIGLLLVAETFLISRGLTQQLVVLAASVVVPLVLLAAIRLRRTRIESSGNRDPSSPLITSLLVVAALAIAAGGSIVVIAFFVGTALAMFSKRDSPVDLSRLWRVGELIVPGFFFLAGTSVTISMPAFDTVVALVSMLIAVVMSRVIIGWIARRKVTDLVGFIVALVPRGEVSLVVLSAGEFARIISPSGYFAGVLMVVATSVASPVLLSNRLSKHLPND